MSAARKKDRANQEALGLGASRLPASRDRCRDFSSVRLSNGGNLGTWLPARRGCRAGKKAVSRLTELIGRAKAYDAELGADLERELKALSSRRAFGLNFERHQPEAVELPNCQIRKGDKVRILPTRGGTVRGDQQLWRVVALEGRGIQRVAELKPTSPGSAAAGEARTVPVSELVVVAGFKDFIYPGLVSTGRVERGGDKPFGKATPTKPQSYEISYLTSGRIDDIATGRATVVGRNPDGSVVTRYQTHKLKMPISTWQRPSHNAEIHGTDLLKSIVGERGLGSAALPLFAAADERDGKLRQEAIEPTMILAPMGEGAQVVEDYRASGLSLRNHPVAFLRAELSARRMITCQALQTVRDGRWIELAGLVLVRQKPGSAKGVMFITLEDETDVANLVVWTSIFEKNRRTVLGAPMMGVRGQVQREGDVIHVIAQRLDDLSGLLASVGNRKDVADIYRVSRADVVKSPMGPDPRRPEQRALGKAARTIYIPDLRLGSGIIPGQPTEGIKVKPRDFR